jgi:hypothetical protein
LTTGAENSADFPIFHIYGWGWRKNEQCILEVVNTDTGVDRDA